MNESTLGQFPLSQESCSEGKGDRIRAVSLVHEPQPLPHCYSSDGRDGGQHWGASACGSWLWACLRFLVSSPCMPRSSGKEARPLQQALIAPSPKLEHRPKTILLECMNERMCIFSLVNILYLLSSKSLSV